MEEKRKDKKAWNLPKIHLGKKKKLQNTLEAMSPILKSLAGVLENKGLEAEGVLRVSGSLNQINTIKKQVMKGEQVDFAGIEDIHVVSGLLKLLLRELEEPLLTFGMYDHLIDRKENMKDLDKRLKVFKAVLANLPQVHQDILNALMDLSLKIVSRSDVNKMTARNIAVVLGPTILRPKTENLEAMMRDSGIVVETVKDIIENYPFLAPGKGEVAAPAAPVVAAPEPILSPRGPDVDAEVYRRRYTELKAKYDELETKLSNELAEKGVLENYKVNLEMKLKAEKDQISELSKALEATNQPAGRTNTAVAALEEQNQQLLASTEKLKADVAARQEKLVQLQVKYDEEVAKRVASEKGATKLAEANAAKLEEQLKKEKDIVSKLEASLKRETQLRKDAETAKQSAESSQVKELQNDLKTLKEDKLKLEAEVKKHVEDKKLLELDVKKAVDEKAKSERDVKSKGDAEAKSKKDLDAAAQRLKDAEQTLADEKSKRLALEKEFESAKKNAQLQASQDASREKTLNKEIADLKAKVSALDANLKQKDKEYQTRLKQVAAGDNDSSDINYHLYNWMTLAIKLDLLSRGTVLNFDKAELYQTIVDKKIPFAQWPHLILKSIDKS